MNYINEFKNVLGKYSAKTAIVDCDGARKTSYGELDILSGQISEKLHLSGLKKGDFVLIMAERSMEYVASYLGILKAGCVVVPALTDYPKERIEYMKNHCEAKAVIDKEFFDDIEKYGNYEELAGDNDSAVLVYTSGSTGKPKGILHTVKNLCISAKRQQAYSEDIKDISFASSAPMNFVAFVLEYLSVMLNGGTVHILPDEVRRDVRKIEEYYKANDITMGFISPMMLKLFNYDAGSLKRILTGSERGSNIYSDKYEIFNTYGLSETLAGVTVFPINKKYKNTPIGKALSGTSILIINDDGTEVNKGSEGEIAIKSELKVSYYKEPELTSRKFADLEDGKSLIHTGDIGYIDENGDVVYVNRMDWMVKINGQRVETLEIEECMKQNAQVRDAVVKAFEDSDGQTYLVGYYVPEEMETDEDKIKEYLLSKLPSYMIPRYFVKLTALPKNANGKLDRNALIPPKSDNFKEEYLAPSNETEEKLCASFEKVLSCGKVGINDNFFALGGDSIKVLRLIEEAGISGLSPSVILSAKTPSKIAASINNGRDEEIISHNKTDLEKTYPLTEAQKGVFFECLNDPDSLMYNIPMICPLPKGMDIDRFAASVKKVTEVHKSFFVAVKTIDGVPSMFFTDSEPTVEMKVTDDIKAACDEFVKPFDIERGPLFRFELCRVNDDYYFLFDVHHLIFDGTSVSIFMNEIAGVYDGRMPKEETLTIFDVSENERTLFESEKYKEAENFFENKLTGNDFDLKPISDIVKDEIRDGAGNVSVCTDGNITAATVEKFVKANKITENTFFMGAFVYTLCKLTYSDSCAFCSVNNGRHDVRLSDSTGMFVKTLPLHFTIDENQKISDFLLGVQDYFLETMSNDCISFGNLCAKYGVNTDITFVYQSDMFNGADTSSGHISVSDIENDDVQCDISVMVLKQNNCYKIAVKYRRKMYSDDFIRSFADMYLAILTSMPDCDKLSDINILSDDALLKLKSFNATEHEYDKSKTVVDLFRDIVGKYPDNVCIVAADKRYTYREIDELSDKLAGFLVQNGISKDKVVGILIPRNEYMVIGALGVLKAGGAYLPLDPSYPAERLNFMLSDSGAKILISDPKFSEIISSEFNGIRIITDDIPSFDTDAEKLTLPSPEDMFTIIYTSGSTGVPKGVMLEHGNIACFTAWAREHYRLDEKSRASAYASFGFDANLYEVYPALTSGAQLHVIGEDIRFDLSAVRNYYNENGITHAFMTTQVGRQMALLPGIKTLKYLYVGGEKLVPINTIPTFAFENAYGPTECTIMVTDFQLDGIYKDVPIGRALDNVKLYVVDKNGKLLPPGAAGELLAAGPHVSRGYLNREEKTKEVFLKNPYDNEAGYERVYKTGDVVRFLGDGNIQFIGRRDSQVKIRGFRIELTEVEEVIRRYPGIKDATIAAFDSPSGGKYIAAYVVSDEKVNVSELNEFIKSEKPPYMVPAFTIQLDAIPYNQNQKVNKKALPEPNVAELHGKGKENSEGSGRRMTKLEEKLVEVIKTSVGLEVSGIEENLMEYGLTSISAITLGSAIEREFEVDFPVKVLLAGGSILDIENAITDMLLTGREHENKPSSNSQILDEYPLSDVQLGIYYESMKNPDEILYNIPFCYKVSGADPGKLIEAMKKAVMAHPILSTHVENRKDNLVQVRNEAEEVTVIYDEICENETKQYFASFVRPFHLHKGPLYRLAVVKTEESVYMLIDIHHIIFDGLSVDILLGSIDEAYSKGEATAEKYTYYEYAFENSEKINTDEYRDNKNYFDNMLAKFESVSEIPADIQGKFENGKLAYCRRTLDKKKILAHCKNLGITPSSLFLAATFYTVSRFAGTKDVYIATISGGRSESKVRETVGMFVRTLPVAMNFEKERSVNDLLRDSAEVMLSSISHEQYPFTNIVTEHGYTTDVMYECQMGVVSKPQIGGHSCETIGLALENPKFKTSVVISEDDENIIITVNYNNALYSVDYMDIFVHSLMIVSENFVDDGDALVSTVSMLDKDELGRIEGFGCISKDTPKIKLMHEYAEVLAERLPDWVALIASDRTLTFGKINSEANIVAHNLIDRGVKVGDSVALLLPRRSYFFTCLLGVLKAGASYIPCDPEYPAERINYIISDSDARFIITTEEYMADYPKDKAIEVSSILVGNNITNPKVEVSPDNLAYMIYTSGSTGKPKGVMLRHFGISNYFANHEANLLYHKVSSMDINTVLGVTTVSFDMFLKDTMGMLLNGKTVVFADESQMNDPRELTELIISQKVDAFNATPSRLEQYMEYKPFVKAVSGCKLICSGGEMYPISLRDKIKAVSEATIINTYGPTEITVSSNMADITNTDHISVGKPILGCEEYIVDFDMNPVPRGCIGELLIGGAGVAVGYKGLPEMTEKNFVTYRGKRVYKSGDYAKWDNDGNVIILGRKDNQVKLRGLRIELGEIEGLIAKQPGIKKAVVIIKKLNGQDNLCAYFTADKQIDAALLRETLKQSLTYYMVPTAYLQMEEMPVTPNGKTDIKSLPDPVSVSTGEYAEPVNEAERFFCDLFAKILKLEKVGATDDFFELGGTSLTVTSVVVNASDNGYPLLYSDIFKYTTPRAIAGMFSSDAGGREGSSGSVADYDYSKIEKLLLNNSIEAFKKGENREIGNCLITGATGYMGLHLLVSILKHEKGDVYCLVRKGRYPTAKRRLKNMLFYYFGDRYEKEFENRVFVYDGDVTGYDSFVQFEDLPIDTVFNCAANVKHFSSGTDIEDVNIGGAKNCIKFCLKKDIRLIHFSTISVSGMCKVGDSLSEQLLDEQNLYIGQTLENKYANSKFIAEREVFEAMVSDGLDGKVIRVGTLAAREEDGEFQINYKTNSFMGRLRCFKLLGCFPYELYDNMSHMGPIDLSADAFRALAKTPGECCLFHAINNHVVPLGDIIRCMNDVGMQIEMVDKEVFIRRMKEAGEDPKKATILQSLLAYESNPDYVMIGVKEQYTTQILSRMGFYWNMSNEKYINSFITALSTLGFFEEDLMNR